MTKIRVNFAEATPPTPSVARTWSEDQDRVFDWFESGRGNLVVRARAGTGKTTTIVEGVSRAPERQILLAAFNKTIATELASRVRSSRVECKTLHALGLRYIKRNWRVDVERTRDERSEDLARRALVEHGFDPDVAKILRVVRDLHTKVREVRPLSSCVADVVDVAVQFNLVPDEDDDLDVPRAVVFAAALRAVELAKLKTSVIDFADMIFLPIVHRWIRPWYDLVVVDETQDMSDAQLTIALGACRRTGRVCVVGDDRQAIYGFRGADVGSMDRIKRELKAVELGLTTTYRCGSSIVELAAQIVPDYRAAPGAALGEIVRRDAVDALGEMRESDFVISRTNAPLVSMCLTLLRRGVRARIRGRDVGKGIVSLIERLRCSSVAALPEALRRHVARELKRAEALSEKAREAREEFVADQAAVVTALLEGAATVAEVKARCSELFSDDTGRAAVMLSTVHRAKGLETDRTFLLEWTFRSGRLEEDNLRYVAITRAKTRLCWVTEASAAAVDASSSADDLGLID